MMPALIRENRIELRRIATDMHLAGKTQKQMKRVKKPDGMSG
jgi:hypothetical protein